MDPFASVELEGGDISASQEDHLRHSPFLRDRRHRPHHLGSRCCSLGSPAYALLVSPYDHTALRHLSHARVPLVFVSNPYHPSTTPPAALCLGPPPPEKTTADAPSGGRDDLVSSGRGGDGSKEPRASKKRSKGTQVTPSESPPEPPPKDGENLGFGFGGEPSCPSDQQPQIPSNNPQTAPGDVSSRGESKKRNRESSEVRNRRKLPASLTNPPPDEGTSRRYGARERSPENTCAMVPPAADVQFPMTLLDVIKMFPGSPNRRFTGTDILEIAKMKGIEFPPPWWEKNERPK